MAGHEGQLTAPAESTSRRARLFLRGIRKTFPGLIALDHVDFTLGAGEIHALMGQNGAGKSTLIKILTGVHARDAGDIILDGHAINPRSPAHAQALGISTVYQEITLIPGLSIAENLYLGRQPMKWRGIDWKAMRLGAQKALARLDLRLDVDRVLASCSIAVQQLVEIARALDVEARVLVLDEPTSSLDASETRRLFQIMRHLKERGMSILFVTHFIDQVYEVADRITVLRNGRLVGEYETANLPRLELVEKMIGASADEESKSPNVHKSRPQDMPEKARGASTPRMGAPDSIVRAKSLGRKRSIAPFDLEISAGEVVGFAGLLGSGRTEAARLIFGLDRTDSGAVHIYDKRINLKSPRDAIRHGLGMLPEDRREQGIVPNLSLRENIVLALQARRGWRRPLAAARQREIAERFIRALGISTTDAEKPIALLSGGNQQKAILARWLATEPQVLILDEPTRGIDVGAKREIEALIRSLCERRMAVLFISSELDEVVRLSDRVVVWRDRAKAAELATDERTSDRIMTLLAAEHVG